MPGTSPRSFIVKKQTPEIPVPASADRNLNQFLQNARERINSLESQIETLQAALAASQATAAEKGDKGDPGDPGAPGGSAVQFEFSFGDATPAYISEIAGFVVAVSIVITIPFNGTGAALTIGTAGSPDLLMPSTGNDPTTSSRYEATPGVEVNEAAFLTITPGSGATQGAGVVYLEVT